MKCRWRIEPDGEKSIVVYAVDRDGDISERRYEENLVSFDEGDASKISIVKSEGYYSEKFCGLGFIGKPNKKKIMSVTITEPKENKE